ncbi:hypothetical protein niasHT_007572 [Heterodera trifolii]|uniref:Protection of telomeres protein 1 ssDNA-binding domain-containing protein n=1 Tax=Heterodera trifolii TaxID=157864 RepID=A0ABD2LPW3_9BILA
MSFLFPSIVNTNNTAFNRINDKAANVRQKLDMMETALVHLTTNKCQLHFSAEKARSDIRRDIDLHIAMLRERELKLFEEVDHIHQREQQLIEEQMEQLNQAIGTCKFVVEKMAAFTDEKSLEELISVELDQKINLLEKLANSSKGTNIAFSGAFQQSIPLGQISVGFAGGSASHQSNANAGVSSVASDQRPHFENCSEMSFDQFINSAPRGETSVNSGTDQSNNQLANFAANGVKKEILVPDATFMDKLRITIRNIIQESPPNKWNTFSRIKQNSYFDIICQVVSVHVPIAGLSVTYLRVCDGTKADIEDGHSFYSGISFRESHALQSQLFPEEAITDEYKQFIYLIGCWDTFCTTAMAIEAGDIVKIFNAKMETRQDFVIHFSLHGHTPNSEGRYKRAIECVRKAKRRIGDEMAMNGGTESESDGTGGKRTRQNEDS